MNFSARMINALVLTLLMAAFGSVGYFWARESVKTAFYEARIQQLGQRYEELRASYNSAVRESAITLLEVDQDRVTVVVRTLDGDLRRVPTPFHPDREIYVDFIVHGGRIWIRRVFDDATAPQAGTVIDPLWQSVDWNHAAARHGKAIYRQLMPGLWEIRVSGNGALNLEPVIAGTLPQLHSAPPVTQFNEWLEETQSTSASLGWRDVWLWVRQWRPLRAAATQHDNAQRHNAE